MLNINEQLLTILSQTVQSKGCTAASRTRFAHAPPRQHGLRRYPLYSLDLKHSRGKTLVFPWLRQFSVHKFSCQMNFCKWWTFSWHHCQKFFLNLHSLHRRCTRLISSHSPRSWTSDLFSSQPRPELEGSPVKSWLHPWWLSGQLDVLHHLCTVPVYKLLFIRQ